MMALITNMSSKIFGWRRIEFLGVESPFLEYEGMWETALGAVGLGRLDQNFMARFRPGSSRYSSYHRLEVRLILSVLLVRNG